MRRTRTACGLALSVVAWLTLAACASSAPARPTGRAPGQNAQLVGVHWRLVNVQGPGGGFRIGVSLDGWLEVSGDGGVLGRDGCGAFQATGHATAGSFALTDVMGTANGCLADHGPLDAMRNGVGTVLLQGQPARVTLLGSELRLSRRGYVLTYREAGPTTPPHTPAMPSTTSTQSPTNN